jgi:hypothetical protein
MAVAAGQYEPQGAILIQSKKTGSAIAKGDLCHLSSGSWQTTANGSATGPFAVCTKAAAAADTTVQLLIKGIVYMTADGAITINNPVTPAATAGQIVQTATPVGTGCCGFYLAHENEGDGATVPTDAADGDIVRVHFGGPF